MSGNNTSTLATMTDESESEMPAGILLLIYMLCIIVLVASAFLCAHYDKILKAVSCHRNSGQDPEQPPEQELRSCITDKSNTFIPQRARKTVSFNKTPEVFILPEKDGASPPLQSQLQPASKTSMV